MEQLIRTNAIKIASEFYTHYESISFELSYPSYSKIENYFYKIFLACTEEGIFSPHKKVTVTALAEVRPYCSFEFQAYKNTYEVRIWVDMIQFICLSSKQVPILYSSCTVGQAYQVIKSLLNMVSEVHDDCEQEVLEKEQLDTQSPVNEQDEYLNTLIRIFEL